MYEKLDQCVSAPARIYDIAKIHKFSSSDTFPKLRWIFNYNLVRFICDPLSRIAPDDYS